MDFQLKTLSVSQACAEKSDALLILSNLNTAPSSAFNQSPVQQLVDGALKHKDLENKAGQSLTLYRPQGIASRTVVILPTGSMTGSTEKTSSSKNNTQRASAKNVRDAVLAGMSALKGQAIEKLTLCLADDALIEHLAVAMQAIEEKSYVYTTTKGTATIDKSGRKLRKVTIGLNDADYSGAGAGTEPSIQAKHNFAHGQALAAGLDFAKEWANRPANFATPTLLGEAAEQLAKAYPVIKCEVLGPKDVAKLGMGSFMSVARGSSEPLRFIVLKYEGAAKTAAPKVLIGKGVTFDTGGISLKAGAGMDEMKFDMCGAASVLGVFRAIASLKPKLNLIGLIPATENMPSGAATKPGDVVTAMDGQTIEILNTDAEGRLILCDALVYAKRFKPAAVVDVATLTGACGIALGAVRAGLFSTDDTLAEALLQAGERAHDLAWRMPLDDEYAEALKSNFADVANVGDRQGGAVTAAKFLERFAKEFPWAHLDIAGVAWRGGKDKGATGRPIGLLLEWLLK